LDRLVELGEIPDKLLNDRVDAALKGDFDPYLVRFNHVDIRTIRESRWFVVGFRPGVRFVRHSRYDALNGVSNDVHHILCPHKECAAEKGSFRHFVGAEFMIDRDVADVPHQIPRRSISDDFVRNAYDRFDCVVRHVDGIPQILVALERIVRRRVAELNLTWMCVTMLVGVPIQRRFGQLRPNREWTDRWLVLSDEVLGLVLHQFASLSESKLDVSRGVGLQSAQMVDKAPHPIEGLHAEGASHLSVVQL
jgi:hypothetical protein